MRQIYVDVDGVLADLDNYYEKLFGKPVNRNAPELPDFWHNINDYSNGGGSFYTELPLLPGAHRLMEGIKKNFHPTPILLTGGGDKTYPKTSHDKRIWVDYYFGKDQAMICCRSATKFQYGRPGDILIDDWTKYRHLWENMGGIFILHTKAEDSLTQLKEIYDVPNNAIS